MVNFLELAVSLYEVIDGFLIAVCFTLDEVFLVILDARSYETTGFLVEVLGKLLVNEALCVVR